MKSDAPNLRIKVDPEANISVKTGIKETAKNTERQCTPKFKPLKHDGELYLMSVDKKARVEWIRIQAKLAGSTPVYQLNHADGKKTKLRTMVSDGNATDFNFLRELTEGNNPVIAVDENGIADDVKGVEVEITFTKNPEPPKEPNFIPATAENVKKAETPTPTEPEKIKVVCPHCSTEVGVTSAGNYYKHKTPEGEECPNSGQPVATPVED